MTSKRANSITKALQINEQPKSKSINKAKPTKKGWILYKIKDTNSTHLDWNVLWQLEYGWIKCFDTEMSAFKNKWHMSCSSRAATISIGLNTCMCPFSLDKCQVVCECVKYKRPL